MIVVDSVMLEKPEKSLDNKYVSQCDTLMLTVSGGKERTEKEFEALSKGAGFSNFRVACSVYATCIMEFNK